MRPSDKGTISGRAETQSEDLDRVIELARAEERESSAQQLELTADEIRLMAGELTAQEMRTVQAVLKGVASRIRRNTRLFRRDPAPQI